MTIFKPLFTAATLMIIVASGPVFAAAAPESAAQQSAATTEQSTAITKEQAAEMALEAHPGKVTKVYEDTKKGKKTWEVKITGDDGKKWEVYYEIATGNLVAEEAD